MNMQQFVPTGEIGIDVQPNAGAGIAISRNTTIERIQGWADAKRIILKYPDMEAVHCVFTGEPIGNKPFAFVRCRRSNDNRIVLCLASCALDNSRYEVVPWENSKGVNLFKTAIQNMKNAENPVDRSLFYLKRPVAPSVLPPKPRHRRPATNRRSKRQLAVV